LKPELTNMKKVILMAMAALSLGNSLAATRQSGDQFNFSRGGG
jgi:hypothetical protein